jgi:thiamine pyrophosphate-dependent acetolactate synthase large subunit-like protein
VGNQAHTDRTDSMLHLSLEQVLPDRVVFALHRDLGFAAIMTCDGGKAQMKAAQFFPHLRWRRFCRSWYPILRIAQMSTCLPAFQEGQPSRILIEHVNGFFAQRNKASGIC